jgi:hypothetical protein
MHTAFVFELSVQELFQSNRIVVFGIVAAIDQGHSSSASMTKEWLPCIRMLLQLLEIAMAELSPFGGIMLKPAP